MISIVIPALNEQDEIGRTVTRVREVLSGSGIGAYEVVVVDDGSHDETRVRAESAGARVVRHPHNVGYGRSLKDGISAARYDTIIINDADGTYPCEAIPALLARYKIEQAKRECGLPTVPSTIALEKTTNPFLRLLEPDIVKAIHAHSGLAVSTASASFEALRNWKNTF